MLRKILTALGVMLLIAVVATYWQLEGDDSHESGAVSGQSAEKPIMENGGDNYAVYVCGAVNNPGVVLLSPNSRVGDAINSCGGLLPNADAEAINLAEGIRRAIQDAGADYLEVITKESNELFLKHLSVQNRKMKTETR